MVVDPPVTPQEDEAFDALAPEPVVAVVIPVGPGREENLLATLRCLALQSVPPYGIVLVEDGDALTDDFRRRLPAPMFRVAMPKHRPGLEQPRNVGVRMVHRVYRKATHVWFLDSDIVLGETCLEELISAIKQGPQDRIVVGPYDWLGAGDRPIAPNLITDEHRLTINDPRWPSFTTYQPDEVRREDLAAGLACFSGNLVWPIPEFMRAGGFWSEIHHGRCEDGELGLRAVHLGIGISFAGRARGWHLWHERDDVRTTEANVRDVPMLDARHPWVQGSDVFVVDRDGKAFDVRCECGAQVPTIEWWRHAESCDAVTLNLPVGGTHVDGAVAHGESA